MRKQFLALILAVLMMLSIAPLAASAAEITYTDAYVVKTYDNLPAFEDVIPVTYGNAIFAKLNGKFGMYDVEANKWLCEPTYDGAESMYGQTSDGRAFFMVDKSYCIYDLKSNRQLTEPLYSGIELAPFNTLLVTKTNEEGVYLLGLNGSEVKVWDETLSLGYQVGIAIDADKRLISLGNSYIAGFDATYHIDEAGNITPSTSSSDKLASSRNLGAFWGSTWNTDGVEETNFYFASNWPDFIPYVAHSDTGVKEYLTIELNDGDSLLSNGMIVNFAQSKFVGRIVPADSIPKPGTPIGDVLYTDIVAYIDDHAIRSYNIAGNTYIVVEDLMAYGFDVQWLPTEGKLVVGTTRTAAPSGYTTTYVPEKNTHPGGTVAMPYLYTEITAWLGDKQVTGYNIGGYTCIGMDDLAAVFATNYVWDAAAGALRLYTQP